MNYAGHEKLRAEVAEVVNTMCDLRARLNDMEHCCRFDSDVLVERLARQTLYRANPGLYLRLCAMRYAQSVTRWQKIRGVSGRR